MNAISAVPSRLDALTSGFLAHPHRLLIDGRWNTAQPRETLGVVDP